MSASRTGIFAALSFRTDVRNLAYSNGACEVPRRLRSLGMTRFIVLVLVIVAGVSTATAQTREEYLRQARELTKQLQTNLDDAKSRLTWTWNELATAQTQVQQVAKERDDWKAYGEDSYAKWMEAEVRVAKKNAALLKSYMLLGGLTVIVAAYFGLKFFTPLGRFMP